MDGQTYGRAFDTHFIRSTLRSLPNKLYANKNTICKSVKIINIIKYVTYKHSMSHYVYIMSTGLFISGYMTLLMRFITNV